MSIPDHLISASVRFVRRSCTFACVSLLLFGSTANAGSTVLGFGQLNPDDVITATDNGSGTTTLSTAGAVNNDGGGLSVPVEITNFLGTPFPNGFLAYETFVGVSSQGAATSFHGLVFQNFSGTIEFTSGIDGTGANFLTATFAPMTLQSGTGVGGGSGSTSAFLTGAEPPDSLVLTSSFASFANPTGMNLSFSNITPALSIAGDNSLASFTAQNAGTFSAAITSVVPEPGSLYLASLAIAAGTLACFRKRMKDEG